MKRGTHSVLVCGRLDMMWVRHPQQDDSRKCSDCGARVGIFPSGQSALRRDPSLFVVCGVCYEKKPAWLVEAHLADAPIQPVPGAIEEARAARKKRP